MRKIRLKVIIQGADSIDERRGDPCGEVVERGSTEGGRADHAKEIAPKPASSEPPQKDRSQDRLLRTAVLKDVGETSERRWHWVADHRPNVVERRSGSEPSSFTKRQGDVPLAGNSKTVGENACVVRQGCLDYGRGSKK